jgi:hypothetical protein
MLSEEGADAWRHATARRGPILADWIQNHTVFVEPTHAIIVCNIYCTHNTASDDHCVVDVPTDTTANTTAVGSR